VIAVTEMVEAEAVCPICHGEGTVVCKKCGGQGYLRATEVKCLWCSNTVVIQAGDEHKMKGIKGQAFGSVSGWYYNGLGYDPDTDKTEVEFFLCPDHQDNESVQKAFAWARDTIEAQRVCAKGR
jgi:hypothetical protein